MKIQKLSEEDISKLQSGLIITDVVQCVLELVHNSLDAEATGIAVRIDFKTYKIQVVDNGKGIGRDDFELVGEKYMTSKYHTQDTDSTFPTYGFKGQALSSLLDVCKLLTIESKSEDDGPTFVKVFQNKKACAINEANNKRRGKGTTVTVEDFMFSMPVRRRRINEMFDIEEIKNQLQYLAVIHYNVCFTLRNENKGVILLQTSQASNTLEAISNIFGKIVAKSLKAVCYEEKMFKVTGFISLKPQFQNKIQLLYVNKRLVTKGMTHKFINSVIKQYAGKNIICTDSPADQLLKNLKSCCYNIFIIEIQCPRSYYELITNVRKTTVEFRNWRDILKNLHKAIKKTFKEVFNLDSSSNIEDNDRNNGNDTNIMNRKLGTSVLMNAVKGHPVSRKLSSKKDKKQKRKIFNQILNHSSASKPKIEPKLVNQTLTDCNYQKEISHDSLESPIPRSLFKPFKSNSVVKSTATFNQSFFEFYEWVKGKLETDRNAFNLYNDFLQSKKGVNESIHLVDPEFKSPVVGGKLKRKKMANPKKIKRKREREQNKYFCSSILNEKTAIVTRQEAKIFPSSSLRIKRAVQFTTQSSTNFPENSKFDFVQTEKTAIFKDSFIIPNLSRIPEQLHFNHSNYSLPSSERQLNNIIKFRNRSESFVQQESINIHPEILQDYTLASGSWASHYQSNKSKNGDFNRQRRRVTVKPLHKKNVIQRNKNAKEFILKGNRVNENSTDFTEHKSAKEFHDVEIQVNVSKSKPQRENAVVQTSLTDSIIPETFNFKTTDVINQGIRQISSKSASVEQINEAQFSSVSQEVPNPDFWNISAQSCHHNSLQLFDNPKEIIKDPKSPTMIEKNSTSSEFICGQKTNSCLKLQNETSISKQTQTLPDIWKDNITEITNAPIATDSKVESESTLPKTIPLEQINWDTLRRTESAFSLAERHDFIPKGLSPTFFTAESSKTFNLSPDEKCKLKLTLDSAREDLLATVKWLDESTGDYTKPIFSDRILDEMRLKAGKSVMNFENQVLSASLSCCAVKVHNLLHSFAFTKELLTDVEILGQLDRKFIVTKMRLATPKKMELVTLFDQHAVDERVKLEELIRDYSSSDGKFIASRLNPSVECILNKSDVRIVSSSTEKLLNFGLNVKAINEDTISFSEIPKFLLNKHEKDVKNKKDVSLSDVLKALIKNIVEEMRETRGALSRIPKIIHNAFCLEACHKAVKFNRRLSIETMTEMINKLKCCKLPFQCAHGRPSVIPIIDLEDFQPLMKEDEIIVLEKIKKFHYQTNLGNTQGSLSTA